MMFEFDLEANGTNVRTEVLAGVTTFLSMVYILAVYPNIMSRIGIPAGGAVIAAALASFFGTFLMGWLAKYPFALAPALITVGCLMVSQIRRINFDDPAEAFPCLAAIVIMPFSYNIADGICFGFIFWTLMNLLCGRKDRVNLFLIILSLCFVTKYVFL